MAKKGRTKKGSKFVQPELLGLKELLIPILQHMQIWLQVNIVKIQTTPKALKEKNNEYKTNESSCDATQKSI